MPHVLSLGATKLCQLKQVDFWLHLPSDLMGRGRMAEAICEHTCPGGSSCRNDPPRHSSSFAIANMAAPPGQCPIQGPVHVLWSHPSLLVLESLCSLTNFFFKSLLSLLQHCFYFMFWFFGHEVCGILSPQPGLEPMPPALEGEVLTTGPPGRSLDNPFEHCSSIYLPGSQGRGPGLVLLLNTGFSKRGQGVTFP